MTPNKTIGKDELKTIQLNILKDVHAFCELNHIKYFLTYGSLIGAIRHNGFIPWDDDIDIAMPRPDYIRFVNSYHSERYEVLSLANVPYFPLAYAKITDKRTSLLENFYHQYDFGVNIDLFPIDGLPDDISESHTHYNKLRNLRYLRLIKILKPSHAKSFPKKALLLFAKAILSFYPYSQIVKRTNKLLLKYNYDDCKFVADMNFGNASRRIHKSVFSSVEKHQFEDCLLNIPVGYDSYLRSIYGDYMKLPPIEQQKSNHYFNAHWK